MSGPNLDVPGCTPVTVQINTGQRPAATTWNIVESCPDVGPAVGFYQMPFTLWPRPG